MDLHDNHPEVRAGAEALASYSGGTAWQFHTMKAIRAIEALDACRANSTKGPGHE